MSQRVFLILLGWAVGLAGCDDRPEVATAPDAGARRPIAHLESKLGTVYLERDGKRAPAELGYVFVDDALETGSDGEAKIRFPGGRQVEVGPDARFVVGQDQTGVVLRVSRGLILSRVPARAPGDEAPVALTIHTPFGLTRIGAGESEVSVDVQKEEAIVQVKIGSVAFVSRNGETSELAAGDRLAAGPEGAKVKPPIVLAPIRVVLVSTGKAQVRRSGASKWVLADRRGEALEQGDALRVLDGRSVLQSEASDARLTFLRGTELVFDGSAKAGEVEESRLDLKKGEALATLKKGSRLVLGEVQVTSDSGGQLSVEKSAAGLALTAITGDVTVLSGDTERQILAGQRATVPPSGEISVDAVAQDELAIPSRKGLRVFHPGVGTASLTWEGGEKDYRVEVASDAAFSRLLLSGVVHRPFVNVFVPARGELHWRVFAGDGTELIDRGSAVFGPEQAPANLSRLRNDVPEGAEKTTIYYQDKPPAVTFTYRPEAEAVEYRILVYREDALDGPVVERTVKEDRAPLEAGVLSEGSYVWSVTPLSGTGDELRGGRMNKLEIVYDNAVPTLVIKSPRNGERFRGGTIEVSGVAPVGAKVFVNGRPALLDDKARFETAATPFGQPPKVVFRMLAPSGGEAITVRVLRRGR